jgi:hypothetical protein
MSKTTNDTSVAAGRRLRCLMNIRALRSMTQPGKNPLQAVRYAGYDGVQFV